MSRSETSYDMYSSNIFFLFIEKHLDHIQHIGLLFSDTECSQTKYYSQAAKSQILQLSERKHIRLGHTAKKKKKKI